MKKIYLKEAKLCAICNRDKKSFVVTDNKEICTNCFIKEASQRFTNMPDAVYLGKKLFKKRKANYSDKEIFAINGIDKLYHGGCTH